MTGPRRQLPGIWSTRAGSTRHRALGLLAWGALGCSLPLHAQMIDWAAAVAARQSFEAEPRGEHTRDEFTQVMNNFRAIYHANPADLHAARAANQVAELLAEQGHELNDRKSLRAAAGQYEFVAKAYPGSSLATPALQQALALLGPEAANDPGEAATVRRLLKEQSPRVTAMPGLESAEASVPRAPVATPADESHYVKPSLRAHAAAGTPATNPAAIPAAITAAPTPKVEDIASIAPVEDAPVASMAPAPAVVTGIRHWSTASYTRVAIDLGGEVQFKAARVEHPDRIFFDLHGAKLAAGLAGKSFAITDDGFLKNIRAGQAGADVTRIVLDVQPVAEYSAFLLPNPYRLIIDIHGRPAGEVKAEAGSSAAAEIPARTSVKINSPEPNQAPPAPISRQAPPPVVASNHAADGMAGSESSSLPPMPVTDGSASFGLPSRRDAPLASTTVARPRVVVSAKPTSAKPVPNSVSSTVPEGSREVASVSEGPGVIAATEKPTSQPVVDRASRVSRSARGAAVSAPVAASPAAAPPPTADGQSTLMRALGLKIGRIVIDAGHGGHDSGTLGPDGIEEKDVVLDVALRLGKLLHDRLGAEVVYTRADDTFVPLETRTAIANKAQADLFISVHANSSQDTEARGVEVYYLNFTSDPEAMQVASRENAVSSQRVNQLSDLVKKIALKDKIDESRELASDVDQSLYSGLKKGNGGLKDRGVKKAPFVVLIGANMPSILAEISFVTNPTDAEKLMEPEYRERVAESLYGGVARYAGAINGAKAKPRTTERAQR